MALINEYVKLNDGNKMPVVGLGTFQGVYTYESVDEMVVNAVSGAVDLGYRHFDTSPLYTTEHTIGQAIRDKISRGDVKREELFITSKLWCPDHTDPVSAIRRSIESQGLDYIDLWLVHWPISMKDTGETWPTNSDGSIAFNDEEVSHVDTWKGMEECQRLGLAKSIGVSNFNIRQIQQILDYRGVKPAVNQIERHAFFANQELVDFCNKNGIHITCYSPLGKINRPWKKEGDPVVFSNPILTEIGKKYNKLPGQVALRYEVQCGHSVVPKSSNKQRQRQNLDIFDFKLDDKDIQQIKGLNQNFRMVWLKEKLGGSKEYPF